MSPASDFGNLMIQNLFSGFTSSTLLVEEDDILIWVGNEGTAKGQVQDVLSTAVIGSSLFSQVA